MQANIALSPSLNMHQLFCRSLLKLLVRITAFQLEFGFLNEIMKEG